MGWFKSCAAVAAVLFAAGCAVTPEEAQMDNSAETAETTNLVARADAPDGEDAVAARVVDATEPPPGSEVACRQMLRQGSNVIVRRCMTRDDWQAFRRQQAEEARRIVRMLQGGAYQ
jgi:hypothetical protein